MKIYLICEVRKGGKNFVYSHLTSFVLNGLCSLRYTVCCKVDDLNMEDDRPDIVHQCYVGLPALNDEGAKI